MTLATIPCRRPTPSCEGKFGLQWLDGLRARRKPLAVVMGFLGPYLALHADEHEQFSFRSWDGRRSPIHLEWNVSGPSFVACGGASSDSPGLRFMSQDDDGVVLVANWSASAVTLFAASDVDVRLTPAALSPPAAVEPAHARVVGAHGAVKVDGEALEMGLLAGEAVRVTAKGAERG